MVRQPGGMLAPATDEDAEALRKIKAGAAVRVEVRQIRNYKFLQKYMTLVKYAFDIWQETVPAQEYRGVPVQPNLKRFRSDLTIMAGHYDPVFNARGELRLEAKSVSFANMSEDDFEALYSSTINVVLQKILNGRGMTESDVRAHVDNVLRYA